MSRSFIADYFDYAKKHGNDPALGFLHDKKISWIPHWLLRSKAKHFALGLLERQAPDQGYFYLLPHYHPEWLYALLAAQSLGLATLTLPPSLTPSEFERITEKYPPSFIYGNQRPSESYWKILKRDKLFKAFILGDSDPAESGEFLSNFRKIHNQGVMLESKYYQHYRQRRESLPETQLLSPIQVDGAQKISDRALKFNQLVEKFKTLEGHLHDKKILHLFAEVNLSRTTDQIAALYWPLSTRKRVVFSQGHENWLGMHPPYHPHLAYLSPEGVSGLPHLLGLGKTPLLQKSINLWRKWRAKRKLGGNLHEIWSTAPLGEEATSFFKKLGIRLWTVEI